MKPLLALRGYLEQHFPKSVRGEPKCSCGSGNHVRVLFFLVDDQPASAIIPEASRINADELQRVLGARRVQPLAITDVESVYAESELGQAQPFEQPFGHRVYFDERMAKSEELVFCPRMFFGKEGECFRAPTQKFLELVQPTIISMVPVLAGEFDDWAV